MEALDGEALNEASAKFVAHCKKNPNDKNCIAAGMSQAQKTQQATGQPAKKLDKSTLTKQVRAGPTKAQQASQAGRVQGQEIQALSMAREIQQSLSAPGTQVDATVMRYLTLAKAAIAKKGGAQPQQGPAPGQTGKGNQLLQKLAGVSPSPRAPATNQKQQQAK